MLLLKLLDIMYREFCVFVLSGYVRVFINKSVIIIIEYSLSFVFIFFGFCLVKFFLVYIIC